MSAWQPADPLSYSYLLGLYLGDGWVVPKPRGGAQLIIVCATDYPQLIEDCWAAVILVSLHGHVTRYTPPGQRCVRLMSSWNHWIDLIPQHGPGRKHGRRSSWRRGSGRSWTGTRGSSSAASCTRTGAAPSTASRPRCRAAGSRSTPIGGGSSPTGRRTSAALFCEYCERLGIRWTQSNPRNVSVSHRTSVALLDSFVPAKS